MAFGPIMRLTVGELGIELAPIHKDDLGEFVSPGMQQASITKYLNHHIAPVYEDEVEWFDRVRAEKDSLIWGIYVIQGEKRQLIGNTGLQGITTTPLLQSTSGSMIFRKDYWGRGIASSVHKARTWYAFTQLGHIRIKSAVVQGNEASLKALVKCGYTVVYTERNTAFVDGELRHQDNLECLNPSEKAWAMWWGNNEPTPEALKAWQKTIDSLAWAEENVSLP